MITNEYEDTIQINKTETGFDVTMTWYDRNYREELHKLLDKMIDEEEPIIMKKLMGELSYCDINGRRENYYLTLDYDK